MAKEKDAKGAVPINSSAMQYIRYYFKSVSVR